MTRTIAALVVSNLFGTVAGIGTTVGLMSRVQAPLAMEQGSVQGIEGYVKLEHDRGNTKLAIGSIGNVENNARGTTTMVRSVQAGGGVTNDGTVQQWSGVFISRPVAADGYDGPVNVKRFDYITFDNGWSIRPDGKRLQLCDPDNVCRGL
jgi:hypothetical protein